MFLEGIGVMGYLGEKENKEKPTYKRISEYSNLPFKFIIAKEQKMLIKSLI